MATTKNPAVLWNVAQSLSDNEKSTARSNIGAASESGNLFVKEWISESGGIRTSKAGNVAINMQDECLEFTQTEGSGTPVSFITQLVPYNLPGPENHILLTKTVPIGQSSVPTVVARWSNSGIGGSGTPLYINSSGTLTSCNATDLRKNVNGSSIGSSSTPVYINSNGAPTTCTIGVGSNNTTINNHMYTSVEVTTDTSGNMGAADTGNTDVVVFDHTFPDAYIPTGTSRKWPAGTGIMLMVHAAIYIVNVTASYVDIQLYQGNASIGVHRYGMPSTSFAGYLTPTFFAIPPNDITPQTHFYLKVGTPDGSAKVNAYTYTFKALI